MIIFTDLIYRPILNLLVGLYGALPGHDIGLVIILVTILIRLILSPFLHKSLKSQKRLQQLQPKLAELKTKHGDDREAHTKATLELYKTEGVNPFSSCLPIILQIPILIALYQVFHHALSGDLTGLYNFIPNPGLLNPVFIGLIDLSKPSPVLAILAGASQFLQAKLFQTPPTDETAKAMQTQILYVLPIISIAFAWRLPAGLPLYWIVTSLFTIAQQWYVHRRH